MSRVQLALNVTDLDHAVAFYRTLFGTEPAKRRPGYANFAITDPPLKLVLIENAEARAGGTTGALNHLGVEVDSSDDVAGAHRRLEHHGLGTAGEEGVACCYAVQDKVWVDDPDGAPWEIYTVLADAEMPAGQVRAGTPPTSGCCAERPDLATHLPGTSRR